MNVCLHRPYLHLSLSCLGVVGGAAGMLKYLNIFKNLKLVKLVFAVLTSRLLGRRGNQGGGVVGGEG